MDPRCKIVVAITHPLLFRKTREDGKIRPKHVAITIIIKGASASTLNNFIPPRNKR